MNEIKIRASSLRDFADCKRRWVDRTLRPEKDNQEYAPALVGTLAHAFIAAEIDGKDADAEMEAAFESASKRREVLFDNTTSSPDDALYQARSIARAVSGHAESMALIEGSETEKHMSVKLGSFNDGQDYYEVFLDGHADYDKEDHETELKTGDFPGAHLQLAGYGMLSAHHEGRELPRNLSVIQCRRVGRKQRQTPPVIHRYSNIDDIYHETRRTLKDAFETVRAVVQHTSLKKAEPNVRSRLCRSYCPLYGTQDCSVTIIETLEEE